VTRTSKFVAAAIAASMVAPAFAIEVKKQVVVSATPAAAWSAIGDFCGISTWHPAVAGCALSKEGKKTLRTLSLNGGGTIVEKMTGWDDAKMHYSYVILSGPLPVANYRSTLSVHAGKKGTVIRWVGKFDAKDAPDEKAAEAIAGVYDGGLASLAKKLGS
jgi:hypothetical protein